MPKGTGLFPKEIWVTHWGDGKRAGNEKWDDDNTNPNDGWSCSC